MRMNENTNNNNNIIIKIRMAETNTNIRTTTTPAITTQMLFFLFPLHFFRFRPSALMDGKKQIRIRTKANPKENWNLLRNSQATEALNELFNVILCVCACACVWLCNTMFFQHCYKVLILWFGYFSSHITQPSLEMKTTKLFSTVKWK